MLVYSTSRSRYWIEDPKVLLGKGPRYVLAPDLNQTLVLGTDRAVAAFLRSVGARAETPRVHLWEGAWALSDASRVALDKALEMGCRWVKVPNDLYKHEHLWVCLTDAYKSARFVTRTDLENAVKAATETARLSLVEKHLPFKLERC